MNLLLGPALGLVLSPADLRALDVAVLHQWSPADLHRLVEGNLLVLDEAALPEVLVTLLLLLGLVVGDVGGVAPLVIAVVALDHIIVLGLLHHLHLVDAPLAVTTRPGSGNFREVWRPLISSLTLGTSSQRLLLTGLVVVLVVVAVVVAVVCVEGEAVDERLAVPGLLGGSRQSPGPQDGLASDGEIKKQLKIISCFFSSTDSRVSWCGPCTTACPSW